MQQKYFDLSLYAVACFAHVEGLRGDELKRACWRGLVGSECKAVNFISACRILPSTTGEGSITGVLGGHSVDQFKVKG